MAQATEGTESEAERSRKKSAAKRYKSLIGESSEGCFRDKGKRDLPFRLNNGGNPKKCFELAVRAGYKYAGLQYGGECWAGNSVGKYGQTKDKECNMPCKVDHKRTCGASWRNNVYKLSGVGRKGKGRGRKVVRRKRGRKSRRKVIRRKGRRGRKVRRVRRSRRGRKVRKVRRSRRGRKVRRVKRRGKKVRRGRKLRRKAVRVTRRKLGGRRSVRRVRRVKVHRARRGQTITKTRVHRIVRTFRKTVVRSVKRTVVKKLGARRMRKMGKKRVMRVVRRALRRKAIRRLRDLGYRSACRGACGRRMKAISIKVRGQRRRFRK